MWTLFWVFLFFFHLAAGLNLTVPDPVSLNVSTEINWTTDGNDPEKFDLRLVIEGNDTGLAMPNVDRRGKQFGTTMIRVRQAGRFRLVAVGPSPGFRPVGQSNLFSVEAPKNGSGPSVISASNSAPSVTSMSGTVSNANPTSQLSSAPVAYPASLTSPPGEVWDSGPTAVAAPLSAAMKPESSNITLIIGVAIGGAVLVICGVVLFIIIQRRRRFARAQKRFVFNRDLMFRNRTSTYDSWTVRSVELEKGIRGPSPHILVTKTTTRDTDM